MNLHPALGGLNLNRIEAIERRSTRHAGKILLPEYRLDLFPDLGAKYAWGLPLQNWWCVGFFGRALNVVMRRRRTDRAKRTRKLIRRCHPRHVRKLGFKSEVRQIASVNYEHL
ncbi:MAG: hypothetical protein V4689_21955, partial [Verrucomicrobiota bacterium]